MRPSGNEARERLKAVMARLAKGERGALEEVYRLTNVKLFGICYRILGDRKEAEDALQDVYISLWRNAARYDASRASPIAWLATFARNRAVDRLRTGKVRRGAVPVDEALALADDRPPADEALIDEARTARVHACLAGLDDPQRSAIRSAFLDGHTYSELAERERVPLGTMKSWIRRGLLKLRECMERGE